MIGIETVKPLKIKLQATHRPLVQFWISTVVFLFATMFNTACSTPATKLAVLDDSTDLETLPMIALESYRDDTHLYVKYRLGNRILYSGGNWQKRIKLDEDLISQPSNYGVPSLLPMQYRQSTPWESLPVNSISMPIFGVEQWRLLRNRLFRSVVPADGSGVVLDFGDAEYFLYYDSNGLFHATRFEDKPASYRVHASLKFDEFMERGHPILNQYLQENNITHKEFVFNTGDTGLYSLPFLYINTERRILVFVRNMPLGPVAVTGVPSLKGGQALSHVLRSHLTNLIVRPVSSIYRLFLTVTDTAVSTLAFEWATGLANEPIPELASVPPMNLQQWEHDLDKIAKDSATSGNIDFLIDGEAFFTRFIDTISRARKTVRLQTYIFDNDDYAVKVGELLKRRSNEGVEVKVLLDGIGTITGTMADSESLPEHHKPPASVSQFLESDSEVDVRMKANPWFTGDHTKSTIIDQQVAFIGGMNIGREYRYDWHDLMMELHGPVVDKVSREFDKAWAHAGPFGDLGYLFSKLSNDIPSEKHNTKRGTPMRVLFTGPGNYQIYQTQLQAMRRAKSYIYVQNAYFTDDKLLREMVMARRRGVDVRVIIPMETDHGPITRSNVLAANLMLDNGIRVFVYPGFSHVKAAIFDGWVCAGSANFDRLSMRVNRELNIASSDPEVAKQLLEKLFEPDFRSSPELTERIPERWADHLIEIIADYVY